MKILDDQNSTEQIKLLKRRNLVSILLLNKKILLFLAVSLFSTYLIFSLDSRTEWWAKLLLTVSSGLVIISIVALFYFLLISLFCWYYSVIAVTDERIITLTQSGILSKHVAELGLDSIQNINYSQKGLLQTIFNYGRIDINTTSGNGELAVEFMSSPGELQEELSKLLK